MRRGRCSSRWSRRWTRSSASNRATTASTSTPTRTVPRYRLFEVDPLKPARDEWKEIIPEGQGRAGKRRRRRRRASSPSTWRRRRRVCGCSTRPASCCKKCRCRRSGRWPASAAEWDGDELLFGFQSFTAPQTVYRLDLKKPAEAKPELWGKVEADVDFAQYEVEQVTYPSKDKTPITMFLAHKKGMKRDGNNADAALRLRRLQRQHDARRSRRADSCSWRRAACWRSPTCAAAASTARTGTRPECSARSRTSSTTSSPRPSG